METTVATGTRLVHLLAPLGADTGPLLRWLTGRPGLHLAEGAVARALQAWPDRDLPPALAAAANAGPGDCVLLPTDAASPLHEVPALALLCRPHTGFARLWRGGADWQLHRLPRLLAWADVVQPALTAALRAETDPRRQYRLYWRAWVAQWRRAGHAAWPHNGPARWPDSEPARWPAARRAAVVALLGLPPAGHDEAAAQRALGARLDRAQAGLRPLLAPLDALRQGLREQHRADPLALALELSLLLKTDPDSYHALLALLPATGLLRADDALALAAQALDPQDRGAQDRVAALLATLPPLAAGKLFRHPVMPRNGALLAALTERALGRGPALQLAPEAWFNLLVLGYAALPAPLFEALLQRLRQGIGSGPLAGMLQTLAGRFRPLQPVPAAPPRRLRIALCLSGQLRGWRHAMPGWDALGLDGHAVDVYLHTWRDLGRRLPDPGIVPSVARVFGPGRFAEAWLHAGRRHGPAALEQAYPTLFAALRAGQDFDEGPVRQALQQRFGGAVDIVVEDEAAPAFAGWGNQDKMHYKIWAAQQRAAASGRAYDLVLRLRPDKTLRPGAARPDWPALAAESRAHAALFCEEPPGLREGLVMGDQFAAGVPEVMAAYADAWTLTPQARAGQWPGFPTQFTGHSSLAWTCLWQGLRPRLLPGPVFGPIAEDHCLDGAPLRTLLAADMPGGPRHEMDRALCAALENSP